MTIRNRTVPAAALPLAGLAALHGYWALGGQWPGNKHASLGETVVGPSAQLPPPPAVWAVAGLLAGSPAGVTITAAERGPTRLARAMSWATGVALLARGAIGLPVSLLTVRDTRYGRLDILVYSPLCLALGAAVVLVAGGRGAGGHGTGVTAAVPKIAPCGRRCPARRWGERTTVTPRKKRRLERVRAQAPQVVGEARARGGRRARSGSRGAVMSSLRALWPRQAAGLPPGQRRLAVFPRFGDNPLRAVPVVPDRPEIQIVLGDEVIAVLDADAICEHRSEQRADFHCVTTWSVTGLRWEGAPFAALWQRHVADDPRTSAVGFVKVRGLDRYAAVLTLDDALAAEVMIADRLDGQPLGARHGAPFRLVSPGQYGYKSVKHVSRIELHADQPRSHLGAKEHLRARVALEERHSMKSGRLLRWPYRLVVPLTALLAERALRLSVREGSQHRGIVP